MNLVYFRIAGACLVSLEISVALNMSAMGQVLLNVGIFCIMLPNGVD